MKIVICTTPIRPVPTDYPPFGSLAVIQALRSAGYDPSFYDIDALRPSFDMVVEHLKKQSPDIIGISAVVSTAYAYVKKLVHALRRELPGTTIILGGNLAASAEILHRLCGVHICVIGEGERIVVNLANHYARNRNSINKAELSTIRGITYLNGENEMVFTGYELPIPREDLFDPDFSILEQYSNLNNFVSDPFNRSDFAQDPRSREPHRVGKKMGTVVFTKGCVARCTFCHRWDKGFRQIPPERVVGRIKYLMDRYNVGFIQFGDENFGSDRKATDELIRLIKPLDVLWQVAGVRARTIDLDLLKRMRDAGCVALYYGFETGSPDMIQVMEKNLDLSHNLNAARATFEAGLYTVYQLVLGMPGENRRTISETTKMIKDVTEFFPECPDSRVSINYIQALPGTPVYEYARAIGLIGPRMEDEEAYLLSISDINAADDTKFLNFTECSSLAVRTWRIRIVYETVVHWYRVRRRRRGSENLSRGGSKEYGEGGYFNLHSLRMNLPLLSMLYPFRSLLIWGWILLTEFRNNPFRLFVDHVLELFTWRIKRRSVGRYRSLRLMMRDLASPSKTLSEESMAPLRLGR